MIVLNTIRNNLIEAIRESGFTQAEIARKVKIKSSTIAQYLSGRAMPALDTLANLCAFLDVSADYILGLEDENGIKIDQSVENVPAPRKRKEKPVIYQLTEDQLNELAEKLRNRE